MLHAWNTPERNYTTLADLLITEAAGFSTQARRITAFIWDRNQTWPVLPLRPSHHSEWLEDRVFVWRNPLPLESAIPWLGSQPGSKRPPDIQLIFVGMPGIGVWSHLEPVPLLQSISTRPYHTLSPYRQAVCAFFSPTGSMPVRRKSPIILLRVELHVANRVLTTWGAFYEKRG